MSYPEHIFRGAEDVCLTCDDEYTDDCIDAGHEPLIDYKRDFRWEICHRCKGEGKLSGYPGAFTAADRAEWSEEDYEDYAETRRPCEDCSGTGKRLMLSDEAWQRPEVQEWIKYYYALEAIYRAERSRGA